MRKIRNSNIETRNKSKIQIFEWMKQFSWKLFFVLNIQILVISYCPSTSLRVVSWSNHFVLRASDFEFVWVILL